MESDLETREIPLFEEITADTPKNRRENEQSSTLTTPDPALKHGRVLPKKLQTKFEDSNLWGKPLEEIDTFYKTKDTFVVVASNYRIYRYSSHNSLYLFDRLNALRRFCLYILTHRIFAMIMTAVILVQLICVSDHMIKFKENPSTLHVIDIFGRILCPIMLIFEFLLKIVAMGFVMKPLTFLRSGWGLVDIFILWEISCLEIARNTVGVMEFIIIVKIIPYNEGLLRAFDFYISCIAKLKEMLISSIVIVGLFTIMGLQMYMGTLTQKCISNFNHTELNHTAKDFQHQWNQHHDDPSNYYSLDYDADTMDFSLCGNSTGSRRCPENYTCLQGFGRNPDNGFTNFDSFGWALLSVLRLITQDFSEYLHQQLVTANGPYHQVYFLLIFFFGTYGLGTFAYSVLIDNFLEMKQEEEKNEENDTEQPVSSNKYICLDQCVSWNFSPGFNSFRRQTHCFVFNPYTELCITVIIILDSILITLNIDQHVFSQIFCWIYTAEFIVKLFAESPKNYFSRNAHILDFLIIVIFVSTWFWNGSVNSSFLVFRMLKLYPRWPSLNFIIQSGLNSMGSHWNLFLFFVVIFLLGVTQSDILFSDTKYVVFFDDEMRQMEIPRWNYMDYPHSLMSTFRIMTGDWIESLWDCLDWMGPWPVIYLIPLMFYLCLLMFILSVAVIITTGDTFAKIEFQENSSYSNLEQACQKLCLPVTWIRSKINPGRQTHDILEETPIHSPVERNFESNRDSPTFINGDSQAKSMMDKIIDNKYYNWLSIGVIILCSYAVALYDLHYFEYALDIHHDKNDSFEVTNFITLYSDILFIIYFSLDILLKILSCVLKKRFDNMDCIVDAVLVFDAICLVMWARPILFLIAFRPFMLVSRIKGLKVVLRGLLREIGFMGKYILAGLFIWLAFCNQGVQLFSQQFLKCVDITTDEAANITNFGNDKSNCFSTSNDTMVNAVRNFDNFENGFYSILTMVTYNGWLEVFESATDVNGVGRQPEREVSYYNSFYFVLFSIFGVFFMFNILIGILAHHLQKNAYEGIFMTFEELNDYKSRLVQLQPPNETNKVENTVPEPTTPFLKFFYDFIENHFFDKFIMFVIFLDISLLTLDHYKMSEGWFSMINVFQFVVMTIYFLEMIFKLLGWRWFYFKNVYNRWDFLVVIVIICGMVAPDVIEKYFISPTLLKMIRIFRVFQFEPFKRRAVLTQKFLRAFLLIKSSFFNLLCFLIVCMCSFAMLFMLVFQHVKLRAGLSELFNFQTFGKSFAMMIQLSTFSGWEVVYEAISDDIICDFPNREMHGYSDCGKPIAAMLLMSSYLSLSFIIVLNMYAIFVMEVVNRFSDKESDQPKQETIQPTATLLTDSHDFFSSDQNNPI